MIALIQRVSEASVHVDNKMIGQISQGILVLLGIEKGDNKNKVKHLVEKVLGYRVFNDNKGKMNFNVQQIKGSMLVISQFTLPADTKKGTRPSFSNGLPPEEAKQLYHNFIHLSEQTIHTESGCFGADMQVSLTNDGPVTFWLQV